jgi:hypothetical protein
MIWNTWRMVVASSATVLSVRADGYGGGIPVRIIMEQEMAVLTTG